MTDVQTASDFTQYSMHEDEKRSINKQPAKGMFTHGMLISDKEISYLRHLDRAKTKRVLETLPEDSRHDTDDTTMRQAPQTQQMPFVRKTSIQTPAQDSFLLLQKWEGVVKKVGSDTFIAQLTDLSSQSEDEEAEIPIEEISLADKAMLAPGAVFYWCIGYRDTPGGQRIRASEIRFRRLPSWTLTELDKARKEAEELGDLLGWK
jgi:hypothetical protein